MTGTGVLVATDRDVVVFEPERGRRHRAEGLDDRRPTCLAAATRRQPGAGSAGRSDRVEGGPGAPSTAEGRGSGSANGSTAWCGTRAGVLRSEDGGRSWRQSGLEGAHVTSLTVSPTDARVVWAGTEPSALWRSADEGRSWERKEGLEELPSSSEWAFPPRPETHHVRWIACHPTQPGRLWLAIEAGALVTTPDGGERWQDRVPGGPYDTHELAIHPDRPETLRVSAGDGYFESEDGGRTWSAPREGLEVGYLRSVAVDPGDPEGVVVSAASRARSAYVAGHSDGRVYRRTAGEDGSVLWRAPERGWPDPPDTIAPLLRPGASPGELWSADERGLHRSGDGGRRWERVEGFSTTPDHLRGMVVLERGAPEGAPTRASGGGPAPPH